MSKSGLGPAQTKATICKTFFSLFAVFLCALLLRPETSLAQTDIYVRGSGRLFPIAVPQLCLAGGASEGGRMVPEVVSRNLDLSGYFEVLNPNTFVESPGKCNSESGFAYTDWSIIGAEGLVKGEVEQSGSELKVRLYLHDVAKRKVVLGKEYQGHVSQLRQIGHKFSNEILKFFTGIPGVFGTRVVYSGKVGRFKELFIVDMDGSNVRQLSDEKGLAVSASWAPSGTHLIYTSYRNRVPDLFMMRVMDRRVQQITKTQELEIGGKFSRDGKTFLASKTIGKASDLVLYNRDGKLIKNLTGKNGIIDVSPSWAPDNTRLAFVSNRAGGPQIYTMNANGGNVRRISFVNSNYCTSPAWSPKGDKIAFVCRADRGYQIFVTNPDGSGALQLTSYGNNEDPSWAPDGRYIVVATTFGRGRVFNLAIMREDGSNIRQITHSRTGATQPAWGPLTF